MPMIVFSCAVLVVLGAVNIKFFGRLGKIQGSILIAAAAALLIGVAVSWTSRISGPDGPPPAVELVHEWTDAVLDRDFERAGAFTFGQSGEREALDGFAHALIGYIDERGMPDVLIADDVTQIGPLEIVCIEFDYGDFAIAGGVVLQRWEDRGLRLSEFRSGVTSCTKPGTSSTTTLPSATGAP